MGNFTDRGKKMPSVELMINSTEQSQGQLLGATVYGLQITGSSFRLLLAVLCFKRLNGVLVVFYVLIKVFIYKCKQSLCLPDHRHGAISYGHYRQNDGHGDHTISWDYGHHRHVERKKNWQQRKKNGL